MRPPGVLAHPFGGLHGPATHRRPGRGDAGDLAAAQPAACVLAQARSSAAEMGHRHRGPAREEDRHRDPGAEDGRSAPCDDARPHLLLAAGITRTGGSTRLTRLTDHQSSPATGLSAVREASAPPSSDKKPPPEIRSAQEIFRARQNAGGSDGNYDGDAFERARRGAAHGGPRAPRRFHRQVERGGRHDAERAESGRPLRPARRSLVCCRRALLDVERDKREEGQATEPRLSVLSTRG